MPETRYKLKDWSGRLVSGFRKQYKIITAGIVLTLLCVGMLLFQGITWLDISYSHVTFTDNGWKKSLQFQKYSYLISINKHDPSRKS